MNINRLRTTVRVLVLGGLLLGCAVSAQSAGAEESAFTMSLDDAVVYEGGGIYGSPGEDNSNDVLPEEPVEKIHIEGTVEGDRIEVAPTDFVVKRSFVTIKIMESYFEVDWTAVGPITGTFDPEEGIATLDLNLIQTVSNNGSSCSVGPVGVTLSTETSGPAGAGSRFEDGLEGPGSMAGSWLTAPEPRGPECDLRKLGCRPRHSLLKGEGAFGMASGRVLERSFTGLPDMTVDKFGITGTESEGGCLPDPVPPEEPEPQLKLRLYRHAVKGNRARFGYRIANAGDASSIGGSRVCATVPKPFRLRKRCHTFGAISTRSSLRRFLTVRWPSRLDTEGRSARKARLTVRLRNEGRLVASAKRRIVPVN